MPKIKVKNHEHQSRLGFAYIRGEKLKKKNEIG